MTKWFPAKGEQSVLGRFGYHDHLNIPASKAADEEVRAPIVVLYTKIAGENGNAPPQKVMPDNKGEFIRRFPEAWAAFNGSMDTPVNGTALSREFHGLTLDAEKAMNFQIQGVLSWEAIAEMSDATCERLGFGTRKLRNDVMTAMGRTPPGKPPVMMPASMVTPLPEPEPPASVSPFPGVDMSDPEMLAAVMAAVQAVALARNGHKEPAGATVEAPAVSSAAPEPETPAAPQAAPEAPAGKRKGWPKGKPRGPRTGDAAAA